MKTVTTSTGKAIGASAVSKAALTALALLSLPALLHANLAVNGNFATTTSGVPNDWQLTKAASGSDFAKNAYSPPSPGGNVASFGAISSPTSFANDYDELSQTIATTAGDKYDITFYLAAGATSYFRAYFGSGKLIELDNPNAFGWKEYTFDCVASSSSTTLAFYGNNVTSWVGLADVNVEDLGTTVPTVPTVLPEPSTIIGAALLLIPLGISSTRILRRKLTA
jgi:hypothetical protein